MRSGAEAGQKRKQVGSGWRKTSFIRRHCGRETRWRERKRKAGGSQKRKRKTGGRRKRKGFPLQQPAPICQIFVKKGRGNSQGYKVDADRSTCTNLLRFKYASAAQHRNNSPCTNVPLPCHICPPKSPAVWKYCLPVHFEQKHKLTVQNFPIKLDISMEEMDGMAKIWENRHRKPKKKKKKHTTMPISEAHSSCLPQLEL